MRVTWSVTMVPLNRKQKYKSLQLRRFFILENAPSNGENINSYICSVQVEMGKNIFWGHVIEYMALIGWLNAKVYTQS